MQNEPLWTVSGITAAAAAILTTLAAFGLPLSDTQTEAIMGLIAVAAPLIVAAVARAKVSSPATVERIRTKSEAGYEPK